MEIVKAPEFENDTYMFIFNMHDKLANVSDKKYLEDKRKAFKNKNINKEALADHLERPSFGNVKDVKDLRGTIYTHKAKELNDYVVFDNLISDIQKHKLKGRKCFLNFSDNLKDYLDPKINTSCLSAIHFLNDKATIFFRASCMENELLYDLRLIKEFFLKPVYGFVRVDVTVVASTAQNIVDIKTLFDNE